MSARNHAFRFFRRWEFGTTRVRALLGLSLLAALGFGLVMLATELTENRPDLYDPTRVALVHAQRKLDDAYHHISEERTLLQQVREAHRDLRAALDLVEKAERLDPADQTMIEELRTMLKLVEDDKKVLTMPEHELRQVYQKMTEQIQTLIQQR